MLFQVYGDNAIYQWIGWILVFCCLTTSHLKYSILWYSVLYWMS